MNLDKIFSLIKNNDFSYWWPIDFEYHKNKNGDWRVEVLIGAILTQNTKWDIVSKNIEFLKKNNFIFRFENIKKLNIDYIKVPFKERKLKTLIEISDFILNNGFEKLREKKLNELRNEILNIDGIGYETCDVILLYVFEKPSFVIDKYTKEFLEYENVSYNKLKNIIEDFIDKNFEKMEKIFENKKIDKKFCNYIEKFNDIPLYPCHFNNINDKEKRKVIIYKELHGMIDEYMKKFRK